MPQKLDVFRNVVRGKVREELKKLIASGKIFRGRSSKRAKPVSITIPSGIQVPNFVFHEEQPPEKPVKKPKFRCIDEEWWSFEEIS